MKPAAALAGLLLAAAAPAPPDPTSPKPVWEVAAVPPDAIQVRASTYAVKPGDTLSAVVRATGASAQAIADRNDLVAPFPLRPGQKLRIPAGRYHTVRAGQSGIAIARTYQVEWQRIIALNHLDAPYTLRVGQRLLLPDAEAVARMTLDQRAAAFRIDLADLATGSEPALASDGHGAPPTASAKRTLSPTTPVAEPPIAFDGAFAWPAAGGRIARRFGPMANGGRSDGITIAAPAGTPITAAANGVVLWVGQHPAFGNVVLLRHGGGWITIYGNAQALLVKRGQAVTIGQTIARVGSSGTAAASPQLFFEVLQGRKPTDPMRLLPRRDDRGSVQDGDTAPS